MLQVFSYCALKYTNLKLECDKVYMTTCRKGL